MKRILLLILSLAIAVSGITVWAANPVEESSDMHQNFAILRNLGIVDWSEDGSVTRAEFISIIMDIILGESVKDYGAYQSPFSDINENTKYRDAIVAAHSYGLINGNGETFSPNDEIQYNEIIKILVLALGYGIHAEEKGGYPSGYVVQANALGVGGYQIDKITKATCARILLDALDAKVSNVDYYRDGKAVYTDGNTSFLYAAMGIYKVIGLVENNGLTGLTATGIYGKDRVVINDVVYKNEFSGLYELLGYKVWAYIQEDKDDTDTIIYACEQNNRVLAISDMEYIGCIDGVVKYENASGTTHTITVPGNAPVIYNNVVVDTYEDTDFDIKNGNIYFINNDGDGEYDVVKIESYTDYFVLSASLDTFIVTDTYNKRRTLNLEDSDDTEIIILNKDGVELGYEDIGENTVLTVAASKDGRYAKCHLSNDLVSGYITSVMTEGDDIKVVLDDVEYSVSKSMDPTVSATIMSGLEAVFYLNVKGKIVGYNMDVRSSEFAYLMGSRSDGTFDKVAKFKLMLANGNIVTVNAKKVYYVDGVKCEDGGIPASLQSQQLVRVKINSNMEVSHIDTVSAGIGGDFDALESFGEMEDKTYWSRGVCQGGIVIPDNIVIFSVPVASERNMNEKEFEVMTKAQLKSGKQRMQMFNAKENSYLPQVMVLENAGSPTISASADTGLVTELGTTLNSDGDIVERVYMMNSVGEAYYDFKSTGIVSALGISVGDVIAYELNGKNQITAANIIVDYDKANCSNSVLRTDTDVTNLTSPTRSYDATFRVRFGYAYAKEGKVLTISDTLAAGVGKSSVESLTASTSMIYKVEVLKGEVKTSLVKFEEIKDYIHFGNRADMVFTFFQSTAPKMIVVYERGE